MVKIIFLKVTASRKAWYHKEPKVPEKCYEQMIYKTDFWAKKKEAAAGGRGEVLYKKSGNDPDRKKQAYSAKTPGHDESKMCCRCFAADVAHNC